MTAGGEGYTYLHVYTTTTLYIAFSRLPTHTPDTHIHNLRQGLYFFSYYSDVHYFLSDVTELVVKVGDGSFVNYRRTGVLNFGRPCLWFV